MSQQYMSMQGASFLGLRVNNKASILREVGNQTSVDLGISTEEINKKETKSGYKRLAGTWRKTSDVSLGIKLDEQKRDDVALSLQAENVKVGEKTVTDEELVTLNHGDLVNLEGVKLSEVVVKDSSTNPETLTEGINYKLDADYGTIKILDLTGFTQPLKVDYKQGEVEVSVLFSLPENAEYYYQFQGINALDKRKLMVELWRWKPLAEGTINLINDEFGEISINGKALPDDEKEEDPLLGTYGKLTWISELED